ncbi:MAG: hypothetical protein R2873_22045 [Caldilineaceae bacterium]
MRYQQTVDPTPVMLWMHRQKVNFKRVRKALVEADHTNQIPTRDCNPGGKYFEHLKVIHVSFGDTKPLKADQVTARRGKTDSNGTPDREACRSSWVSPILSHRSSCDIVLAIQDPNQNAEQIV